MEEYNIIDVSKIYVFYVEKLVDENKAVGFAVLVTSF